jgi:hypothetical protein
MNRRFWLKALVYAGFGAAAASAARAQTTEKSVVLYTDFVIDPADEAAMLQVFHTRLKPVAEKHDGYIDLKLLRMKPPNGSPPATELSYRYQLTYETDPKRRVWVASDDHKQLWPVFSAAFRNVVNRVGEIS